MAPRYPSSWVDQVYANSSIVDLVSAYLPLQKKGRRHWGLCPFHNEKTPSFSVNQDLNLYYCFGCKASGNIVQFVMEMEKLTYPEALLHLSKHFHLPPPPTLAEDPEEERQRSLRERLIEATREAAKYYHDLLWTDEGVKALEYLHGRGLDDSIIRRFGIGASPNEWDSLLTHLTGKGYTPEELQQAALITVRDSSRYDVFRDRVMFPIINRYGQTIGFGARALGNAQPKYLNTSDSLIYNKRSNVYGINLLKRQRNLGQLILVEGYMDVIALSQNGINNAVATLGTSLTPEQARIMKSYAAETWICYDGDEPGQTAALRALDILNLEGITSKVIQIPGGEDPDEFIRAHGQEAFHALKPVPAMAFRLSRLEKGFDMSLDENKREYARQACQLLQMLREPVETDYYLGKISVKTGISKDVLAKQMQLGRRAQSGKGSEEPLNAKKSREVKPKTELSEITLAALLATGFLPEGFLVESDFNDPAIKTIARGLLNGKSPAAIMDEMESDEDRVLAGELFNRLPDLGKEEALSAAEDCLNVIRTNRINQRISMLNEEVRSQEGEQKLLTLQLIRELRTELERYNKYIVR